jgi:uncharacterized protein (TIGR02569 family)
MTAPSPAVLTAFGCDQPPSLLAGGRGLSWRSGDVVLKPAEENLQITDWLCDTLSGLVPDGFRVCAPLQADTGAWHVDGWTASTFEPGTPADVTGGPWSEVVRAGAAFGRATAALEQPWFTTVRTDPWAIADRVAWQEKAIDLPPEYAALVTRLTSLAGDRPQAPDQVVHGDLTGNVLLHPGLDPLILDFSPYWRPGPYALTIVITDALSWYGADPLLLRQHADDLGAEPLRCLARSLIFRVVVSGIWAGANGTATGDLPDFVRVADQLTALADAG